METSPNHLLNCFQVMFSCKTLLLNITQCFCECKRVKKARFFTFFKRLVVYISQLFRKHVIRLVTLLDSLKNCCHPCDFTEEILRSLPIDACVCKTFPG